VKQEMIAEIVSLSGYESQVAALLNDEERMAMEFFIACAPEDHPVIPGSGGFRKARWSRRGEGKSGGFRVVYFFLAGPGRIYMAAIYAKSRKETLSGADQNVLAKLAAQIKKAAKKGG
jgi:RelE toxin of RelE / RelB toxin-antitoxin system